MRMHRCLFLGVLATMASACSAPDGSGILAGPDSTHAGLPAGEVGPEGSALEVAFAAAGEMHGVPAELLKSIAWAETRWHMVSGEEELEGFGQRFGLMALRDDVLEEATELA